MQVPSKLEENHGPETPKRILKEKFVDAYETFFKGLDPVNGYENFWDELFLFRVNGSYLERCVMLTSEEELLALKENLHKIFFNCALYLDDQNMTRVSNALQTLLILLKNIFRKKFTNFGFSIINIIVGFEASDAYFQGLLKSIENILLDEKYDEHMKKASLELLLAITTGNNNIDENILIEYMISKNMFIPIFKFISGSHLSPYLSYDAALLLVLLANYRKSEGTNPYLEKIKGISMKSEAQAIGSVLGSIFHDGIKFYEREIVPMSQSSMFPTFSGIFGALGGFLGTSGATDGIENHSLSQGSMGAGLMLLYECLYNNGHILESILDTPETVSEKTGKHQPSDGIANFLCFSSFLFQDIKDMRSSLYSKLCFLILLNMTEQPQSVHAIHNANLSSGTYRRFDRTKKTMTMVSSNEPIVSLVISLSSEFILSNLKKKMRADLYSMCFAVIHRSLCHQKKVKARLRINWVELWKALIQFCSFISSEEMMQNQLVLTLAIQAIALFNYFITFGDNVLPRDEYDHLYCEIIRVSKVFERMHGLALRHDVSGQLSKDLSNIRTITAHFTAKIDAYAETHRLVSLSREQVFEVIRSNYESLKLKLSEGLDVYIPYVEQPNEVTYFRQLITHLVHDATGRK